MKAKSFAAGFESTVKCDSCRRRRRRLIIPCGLIRVRAKEARKFSTVYFLCVSFRFFLSAWKSITFITLKHWWRCHNDSDANEASEKGSLPGDDGRSQEIWTFDFGSRAEGYLTSSNSHHNSERAPREFSPTTVTTRRLSLRWNNSRSYLHALEWLMHHRRS